MLSNMALNLVFSVLSLAVLAMAHGPKGHGGPHGGPPGHGPHGPPLPFLANLTAEQQKAFEEVFHNENLTISEIDTQVAALAMEYGVSDVFTEFQANQTAHLAEVKKNQTTVISNLSSISSQLDAIFSNKDQTRQEQLEAVEALRKEHPLEVDTLHFLWTRLEGPKGGRHGGPRGGQRRQQGGRVRGQRGQH